MNYRLATVSCLIGICLTGCATKPPRAVPTTARTTAATTRAAAHTERAARAVTEGQQDAGKALAAVDDLRAKLSEQYAPVIAMLREHIVAVQGKLADALDALDLARKAHKDALTANDELDKEIVTLGDERDDAIADRDAAESALRQWRAFGGVVLIMLAGVGFTAIWMLLDGVMIPFVGAWQLAARIALSVAAGLVLPAILFFLITSIF